MDVSFIVPALNEEGYIEKTLKSIKSQKTKLKTELIVVDGNSRDKTVKIAKKYAKVIIQKTKGIADARNIGARKAKGKLLIFIDADTTLAPDYLKKVWEYMTSKKKVVAITAKMEFDSLRWYERIGVWLMDIMIQFWSKFGKGRLTGVNTVVWRSAFEKVKGFPNVHSEDIAFTRNIQKLGRTEYLMDTYTVSSSRRFHTDKGFLFYYILRDLVTFIEMSRFRKKKVVKKVEKKLAKQTEYKEIR